MRKSNVNQILDKGFRERLRDLGFKKIKEGNKKQYNGFSIRFVYAIADYGDVFPTSFSYRLSYNKLNRLYAIIFDKEEKELGAFSSSIETLYEEEKYPIPEYMIQSKEDTLIMLKEVTTYMKDVAIPFLESMADFKALDAYYNQKPTRPDFGARSLIIAKMADNPNYEKLKTIYRKLFIDKNWAVKEDIEYLEKTIYFLDKHTKEELEEMIS